MIRTEPVLLPLPEGRFRAVAWRAEPQSPEAQAGPEPVEHLSLTADPPVAPTAPGPGAPLVRVHSECLTGDVFGSGRCDCGPQLHLALRRIAAEGGTLLYLRGQEGRGIGLLNKIRAYALQEAGRDTVDANLELGLPAEARHYAEAAAVLRELGLTRVRLLSNNPDKARQLAAEGIEVVEQVPLEIPAGPDNLRYLQTKRDRMQHALHLGPEDVPATASGAEPAPDPVPTPGRQNRRTIEGEPA